MSSGVESYKAFADGGGTVSSTALSLSDAPFSFDVDTEINRANRVRISNIGLVSVSYRYSGSTATASAGHLLTTLTSVVIEGNENIRNLSIIRVTTDATIWITLEE